MFVVASTQACVHPDAVVVTSGYAYFTYAAMLASSGLFELTCPTNLTRVEKNMVKWIIGQTLAVVFCRDHLRFRDCAKVGENIWQR